jgi:hypothetical protein
LRPWSWYGRMSPWMTERWHQFSVKRDSELRPTAWRLFENIGLVVPICGCFAVLEHLFIFFFLGLAMPSRLVTK